MTFATVRMLKNQTSEMLRQAAKGKDVLITSHGKPVALLHGLSESDLEDLAFSQDTGLRASIEAANRAAATTPLDFELPVTGSPSEAP